MAWLIAIVAGIPVFVYILNGGLYLRDKALIPLIPLFCYMLAMYLKKVSREEFSWIGCIPYVVTMELIYIGRSQDGLETLWPFLMIESQIMLGCYLAAGMLKEVCQNQSQRIKNKSTNTILILAGSMALFLAVFDNQYALQKHDMLDTTFYEQVTDSEISDAIQTAADEAKKGGGFYRTVQLGSDDENAADLNRVWNMDQYISSIYSSSYNKAYQNFRKDTFGLEQPYRNFLMQSEEGNPIFERFMGEKYVVSKKDLKGYKLLKKSGDWNIYENENVAPIIYGTSRLMSEKDYDKLEYPYNQTELLKKAVVPENGIENSNNNVQDSNNNVEQQDSTTQKKKNTAKKIENETIQEDNLHTVTLALRENAAVSEKDGGYHISAKKDTKVNAEIVSQIISNSNIASMQSGTEQTNSDANANESIGTSSDTGTDVISAADKKVLMLRFKVQNLKPSKDLTIWVNGDRNKLSAKQRVYYNDNTMFTYAVPLDSDENQVEITFGKGKYDISNVESYVMTMPGTDLYESEFLKNETETKGNVIAGQMSMEQDGYLITSIPYDSGFEIQIDGKTVKAEKVNTAFLGCKVNAGDHDVVITYHAPGLAAGKIMSLIGMIGFMILFLVEYRCNILGKTFRKIES